MRRWDSLPALRLFPARALAARPASDFEFHTRHFNDESGTTPKNQKTYRRFSGTIFFRRFFCWKLLRLNALRRQKSQQLKNPHAKVSFFLAGPPVFLQKRPKKRPFFLSILGFSYDGARGRFPRFPPLRFCAPAPARVLKAPCRGPKFLSASHLASLVSQIMDKSHINVPFWAGFYRQKRPAESPIFGCDAAFGGLKSGIAENMLASLLTFPIIYGIMS
jgi:hypothetical protein